MTISTTTNRATFTGNGVTTAFSFPYYFADDDDLKVILRVIATGVETVQTKTTHYTVSGAGDSAGGTVTMLSAPSSSYKLIIVRNPPSTQDLALENGASFDVDEIEARLDYLTVAMQRAMEWYTRSVRLTDGFYDTAFSTMLPGTVTADAVLKVNADGNGFEFATIAAIGALSNPVTVAQGGTGSTTAAAARTALGLAIGTDVQAYDADLSAIAALTSAADKLAYATGAQTWALTDLTSFARTVLDDANASAARTTLGVAIGTDVQAYDADLSAFAGLSSAANKVAYFTGNTAMALADFTSYGRSIVAVADEAAFKALVNLEIGTDVQAYDADLSAIAALTSAADKLAYATGAQTWALTDLTAFGRSLIDDAAASNARTTLGLVIGTDVQAYDADLAALAALSGTNTIYYRSASDTWTAVTIGTNLTFAAGTLSAGAASAKPENRLDNAGFSIDQKGHSATSVADDVYCLDRWYVLTQTAAIQVTQQSDQEDGTPYNARLTQSQASAQRMGLAQILESADSRDLRGQSVAAQARVRISNSQAIRYAICEWTSTADSVTSDVVNDWTSGTYTAGNFFLAANLNPLVVGSLTPSANTWTDLTAITATVGSSANNLILFVWTEGTAAQNVTLDIGRPVLNKGATTTTWEEPDQAGAFAECLRHYEVIGTGVAYQQFGFGGATAATTSIGHLDFSPKRIAPTITVSAAADFATANTSSVLDISVLSLSSASKGGARYDFTCDTGLTAGDAARLMDDGTGNARIYVSANL